MHLWLSATSFTPTKVRQTHEHKLRARLGIHIVRLTAQRLSKCYPSASWRVLGVTRMDTVWESCGACSIYISWTQIKPSYADTFNLHSTFEPRPTSPVARPKNLPRYPIDVIAAFSIPLLRGPFIIFVSILTNNVNDVSSGWRFI